MTTEIAQPDLVAVYNNARKKFRNEAKRVNGRRHVIQGVGQTLQNPAGSLDQKSRPAWPTFDQLEGELKAFKEANEELWTAFNNLDEGQRRKVRPPDQMHRPEKGRKNGSILFVLITALIAVLCAIAQIYQIGLAGLIPSVHSLESIIKYFATEGIINFYASLFFAIILIWWAVSDDTTEPGSRSFLFYPNRSWGLGFETVTMTVTVIAALIVIFTFTHELRK